MTMLLLYEWRQADSSNCSLTQQSWASLSDNVTAQLLRSRWLSEALVCHLVPRTTRCLHVLWCESTAPTATVFWSVRRSLVSPCARAQIRAKSDPCSAVDFLSGTVRADFFVLPDSSFFWSHFSAANYKTAKFSFKILCRCAELPAKRMDSARRSARVLASSCAQHSRRAAHSSRRSKRGDYSAI